MEFLLGLLSLSPSGVSKSERKDHVILAIHIGASWTGIITSIIGNLLKWYVDSCYRTDSNIGRGMKSSRSPTFIDGKNWRISALSAYEQRLAIYSYSSWDSIYSSAKNRQHQWSVVNGSPGNSLARSADINPASMIVVYILIFFVAYFRFDLAFSWSLTGESSDGVFAFFHTHSNGEDCAGNREVHRDTARLTKVPPIDKRPVDIVSGPYAEVSRSRAPVLLSGSSRVISSAMFDSWV